MDFVSARHLASIYGSGQLTGLFGVRSVQIVFCHPGRYHLDRHLDFFVRWRKWGPKSISHHMSCLSKYSRRSLYISGMNFWTAITSLKFVRLPLRNICLDISMLSASVISLTHSSAPWFFEHHEKIYVSPQIQTEGVCPVNVLNLRFFQESALMNYDHQLSRWQPHHQFHKAEYIFNGIVNSNLCVYHFRRTIFGSTGQIRSDAAWTGVAKLICPFLLLVPKLVSYLYEVFQPMPYIYIHTYGKPNLLYLFMHLMVFSICQGGSNIV